MLSVPWFLGWALRPYIQINKADDASSPSAAKPVNKPTVLSSATFKPASSAPAPASKPSQPSSRGQGNEARPQVTETITVSKTTAAKTSAIPTPLVAKQAQPVQQQQQSAGPQVSTKTINLTMSTEWAARQIDKFKISFDDADKDKSGTLSFQEVLSVLQGAGFKGSPEEAKKIFDKIDVDKDQRIQRSEFEAAMNRLPRITIKEFVLRKTFVAMDKDKSGTLSRQEIEDATKETGLNISTEKIGELLIALTKDSKDKNTLDYEEFLRVFGVQQTATVMHQVFERLDKDKSGFLTKDEIIDAIQNETELKLRAAKISDLLVAWHKDKDQKINYEEFVQVWLKYK